MLLNYSSKAQKKERAVDTTQAPLNLDELVLSISKWEQNKNEIPNRIIDINKIAIIRNNPQTSADMMAQSGGVFVQKSQLGGGSPIIRGFAANRVLMVVDGVRMNNAIYRSGNLQNIISINPQTLQKAEVIFGPGAVIYGSDAIGGVMDFHSIEPNTTITSKKQWETTAFTRFASANREKTIHADVKVASKKWAFFSAFTYSDFDDLKMGKRGGDDSYLRHLYVAQIGGTDSVIANPNPRIQKHSGYQQLNLLQKLKVPINEHLIFQYGFHFSQTSTTPRYDRLLQVRNNLLRFAEWNYGPMIWRMHNINLTHTKKNGLYNEARLTAAYQHYNESRIDRPYRSNNRNIQSEKVAAYSFNWDAFKTIQKSQVFYGIEWVYNKVGSSGSLQNRITGITLPAASRYPDGSQWNSVGIYLTHKRNTGKKISFLQGLRWSSNQLTASFDNRFIAFPFKSTQIKDGAFTGNLGLVYRAKPKWQFTTNFSTGFRMPNIDDMGKLFETAPSLVTVPNPNLRSEYAYNGELGVRYQQSQKATIEINAFYTRLKDAIVRRPFRLNGSDSITIAGITSAVEALQNTAVATVYGLQGQFSISISKNFTLVNFTNWIAGKETDDDKNTQVPLRHAPPFYGSTQLNFQKNQFSASAFINYNAAVNFRNLAPSEIAKTEIYAKDANGNPFSPAWYNFNIRMSYQFNKQTLITTAWENITNQRYRPYSSGIVAAGSNWIISVRKGF
jgi:hemoglobin/transferrin/lactoferrin receptor protein